jgi:MYXO-CTERM domain-containing protein
VLASSARVAGVAAALALAATTVARPANAGTWTPAPLSPTNGGPAFGLWLLTDGTVLSHGNALNHWVKLIPDSTGGYANGTWMTVASSAYARGGAQEHVLRDGRFYEAGGEYIYVYPGCAANCAQPPANSPLFNNVEIYDPVANTWTIAASAILGNMGDSGSATLADGRILASDRNTSTTQIYDPVMNKWTMAAKLPGGVTGDENAWASLQNGGVLAVFPHGAAIYDPAGNKWTPTGPLPAGLAVTLPMWGSIQFGDVGGISLMFDGRVLAYGLGTTAIYTPGPTASDPGTWALGPNLLKGAVSTVEPGNEAEDEYTVTEPNGKVMIATYPYQGSPNLLQEFDPTTNTFAAIQPPPDPVGPYPVSYLNLPNGQVMVTAGSRNWLYTPDSPPQDAWRPTVTTVTYDGNNTYTLTGTQLSGLINGGDEGDDMTMAENYPIVWLKDNANHVYYCRSFNFSTMMPSKGTAPQTCQFTTPQGLPNGMYSLFVSSVGVQSKDAFPFTVGVGGTGSSSSSGSASSSGTATSGGSTSSSGGAGTGGATGSSGATGAGGNPNGGGSSGAGGGGAGNPHQQGGCGCRTTSDEGRGAVGLALMLGLVAFGRRRRDERS